MTNAYTDQAMEHSLHHIHLSGSNTAGLLDGLQEIEVSIQPEGRH